jgi:hypothetical protein
VEAIAWATVLSHHAPFLWPCRRWEGAREGARWRQIYWPKGDDSGGRGRKLTTEEERGGVGAAGGEVAGGGVARGEVAGGGAMGGRSQEQAERERKENGRRS